MVSHCGFTSHFLMTSDVAHHFLYLLSLQISSSEKCLLLSFAYFVIGLLFAMGWYYTGLGEGQGSQPVTTYLTF